MKSFLISAIIAVFMTACGGNSVYKMTTQDKEKQRGFHANQARETLDANEANKKANAKAAYKAKLELNDQLNSLNKNKATGKEGNNGLFKFY